MRYFFEVAYNGTNYHGWQIQQNATTIQQLIEEALSVILRTKIPIMGSGRTDTGVHCSQQYFHADLPENAAISNLRYKLNSFLPPDISINSICKVTDDAHARFTALSRSYEYRITQCKDPFLQNMSYFYPKSLDITTMNEAASLLVGKQDFESFSKVKTDVNNFVCDITEAQWVEKGDLLIFHITANRFLRGMVRAIVGTLLMVGKGKLRKEDFKKIIESKDRKEAGAAAPAAGLFLTAVKYPREIFP
ncbi:tRNA pseudouridine(38-40) synthase TruA [Fulvivirga sp. 29W222]|uniref:tRNA pseudouridine synthase A n=1 Tax=Fulvivirga marina TaxID=2494733 RepID=A0A937FUE0_9BACT|nr:tRNA pseudouridine(38-40) synthase TruA [Fulvivirga marina]MBL6446174.1 tRNA pseudouridine(38-40) synthase TruA [Fulvivirga marina]